MTLSVERVQGLLEKATPGGWTYDHPGGHYERGGEIVEEYSALYAIGHDDGTVAHDIVSAADAELLSVAPDLAAAYLSLHEQLEQVAQGVQAVLAEARESAEAAQRQMDAHLVTQQGFAGSDGSRAAVHQRYIHLLSQVAALPPRQAAP